MIHPGDTVTRRPRCAFCGGRKDCAGRCPCYPHPRQRKRGFAPRPAPLSADALKAHHARALGAITREGGPGARS